MGIHAKSFCKLKTKKQQKKFYKYNANNKTEPKSLQDQVLQSDKVLISHKTLIEFTF